MPTVNIQSADYILIASSARTVDHSVDLRNVLGSGPVPEFVGMMLIVDVTARTLTPLVAPTLQVPDGAGNHKTIHVLSQFGASVTQYAYLIHPNMLAADFAGDDQAQLPLPAEFRILFDHDDSNSITYSVRAMFFRR